MDNFFLFINIGERLKKGFSSERGVEGVSMQALGLMRLLSLTKKLVLRESVGNI